MQIARCAETFTFLDVVYVSFEQFFDVALGDTPTNLDTATIQTHHNAWMGKRAHDLGVAADEGADR